MKRIGLLLGLLIALWSFPAEAQNSICPTAPIGTSNNQCASTAFVQNQLGVGVPIAIGVTSITGGTSGRVLYDNSGAVGEYTQTQLTAQINGVTPLLPGLVPAFPNTTTVFLGTGNYGQVANGALVNPSLTVTATTPLTGGGSVALGASTSIGCQAASGSQAGCLSAADWTTFNGKQTAGNYITALTGDVMASGPGSVAATLATVNAGPGLVGSSTAIPVLTTNGKGLVTSQSTAAVIAPAGTLSGTTLNSTVVNSSLTSVGTLGNTTFGGTITAASLSTAGTIAGSLCQTSAGLFLYEVGVNCFAASAASITVGTTTVASGTSGSIFYQNGASPTGTIGQIATTGSAGSVVLSNGPTIAGETVSGTANFTGTFQFGGNTQTFPGSVATLAALNIKESYTAAQRGTPINIAISTATFTPNFDTAQNFEIDLASACPCTLANPSTTLVAGQSGMIEIHQDGTGSRTIGTWGSDYQYVGGTSSITLSTAASAIDYLPYYVNNAATGIVFGGIVKGPAH